MLYIYNQNMFALGKAKDTAKKLIGRFNRGPQAVLESLTAGLNELAQSFVVNQKISIPLEIACVLSGAETLNWAIEQKQKGKIKKIVAGPNIVVFPDDEGRVLRNPLIDAIIVPGQWVKELYSTLAPEISGKIRVWPAGVEVPKLAETKKDIDFLIYDKTRQGLLFRQITDFLARKKYNFQVLSYGKFKQADYFELLGRCKFEIYLSESESQGLAMFEAWARNVPTLVWESGRYEKKASNMSGQISAPYLSFQAGAAFYDREDFETKIRSFIKGDYSPRRYVEENFSNKICAQKYLAIVYER